MRTLSDEVGSPRSLDRIALKDDVQGRGQVYTGTQNHNGVVGINESFLVAGDTVQHKGNG